MQDIAQQKLMQQLALAQQNSQVQEAGQQHGSVMSGLSPLAMAMMLRKKKPGTGEMVDEKGNIIKDPTYGAGDAYSNMTPGETSNMMANGV
jgi:hypothetical protein